MPETTDRSPITVVVGDEELLVERAVARVVAAVRAADADADIRAISAGELEVGQLAELTSPSLFGDRRLLVIRDVEQVGKEVVEELTAACREAGALGHDTQLVFVHKGGARGKAVVDAALSSGGRRVECPKLTRASERIDFVKGEFKALGRTITDDGARALLDAVGNDVRELAAACAQLGTDTDGRVDAALVGRYYRGRAEAGGFAVADRAIEGRLGEALEQLRWALAVGTAPVLITSALAQGIRSLAKVANAPRGLRGADLARELAMPPWKVDRVKTQLRGWTPAGVAASVQATAIADEQVKGGGTDAGYALEKAIMAIVAARQLQT
ncbi:MAG: DNA polymerase III subunit delta [Acidothermaceae bacterium]